MKTYLKLMSMLFILIIALMGISVFGVSAEGEYTQPEKFIYGDVDMDGVVTVKDATLVQKGVADITYVTAVQKYLADPTGEGFSVKNATAIQKYLADIEINIPVNEELVMASQDEFSGKINVEKSNHRGEYLYVSPKNMDCEYTLEDFPEYRFSRIEKRSASSYKYVYYKLYLQEPGRENALEAVKALDYRVNIDLKAVDLDAYPVPA